MKDGERTILYKKGFTPLTIKRDSGKYYLKTGQDHYGAEKWVALPMDEQTIEKQIAEYSEEK